MNSIVAIALALSLAPVGVPSPDTEDTAPAQVEGAPADEGPALSDAETLEDALLVEARDRYVEGRKLFIDRNYLDAALAFERSYAAVPGGTTLYAMALSYEKAGNYVQALEGYLRYLDLPECPADGGHCSTLADEVKETVTKLRGKVGRLTIVIDEGVELQGIEIDDRFIPPDEFPLVLTPGRYELRVRGIRRDEVRTRQVEIAAGELTSLLIPAFDAPDPVVDLEPAPREELSTPPPGRRLEEERRRRLRIAFYSGVGATAASAIVTGVVGGLTLNAYNEWGARCKGEGVDCSGTERPTDAKERFDRLQPVTNAMVGITAAAGITTVVLGLFAFSDRQGPSTRASVTRVTPTPGGVRVRF